MKHLFRQLFIAFIAVVLLSILSACGTEGKSQNTGDKVFQRENLNSEVSISENRPDYSLYVPVLENAVAEQPYPSNEYGMLYDIDDDCIDELFLLHSYPSGGAFPVLGYSVYDIENDLLVARAEKQDLMILAGGGRCFAGITNVNGEDCFFTYGLQVGDCFANSIIAVYNSDLSLLKTLKADMLSENVPIFAYNYTATYSVDENFCTEEEYFDQLDALFPFDTSCFLLESISETSGQFYNGQWFGDTIGELLLQIRESYIDNDQSLDETDGIYDLRDTEFVAKDSRTAAEQYLTERVLPYYEIGDSIHTLTYFCQTYNPESYSSITADNMYCGDRPQNVLLAYNICDLDGNGVNDLTLATVYYSDPISLYDYSNIASGERIFTLVHGIDTFLFDQDGRVSAQYHEGNGNFGDVSGTPEKFSFFFSGKYFVYIAVYDFSETDINGVYYPVTDAVKWHTESLSIMEFNVESGEYDYVNGLTRFVEGEKVRYYDDCILNHCIYTSVNPNYGEFQTEEEAINKIYSELSKLGINSITIEPTSWEQRWEKSIRAMPCEGQTVTVFELQPSVSTFCGNAGTIKEKYPDIDFPGEYRNLRGTTTGDMIISVNYSTR